MARRKSPPAYSRHSGTNLARVRIDGKVHYLGEYGSSESKACYSELVAEWLTEQGTDFRNCPRLSVAKVAVETQSDPRNNGRLS